MGWQDAPLAKAAPQSSWQDAPLAEAPKPKQPNIFERLTTAIMGGEENRDRMMATHAKARETYERGEDVRAFHKRLDVANSRGTVDRGAALLARGAAGFDAGMERLGQAFGGGDPRRAGRMESIAATRLPDEVTFSEVKEKPSMGNLGRFVLEQGVLSLPAMGAAIASPLSLVASQTGNIGQQRAVNDGRDAIEGMDALVASPFAVASTWLERTGLAKMFAPGAGGLIVRTGKAAGTEALTETAQSGLEYLGGTAGTEKGVDVGDLIDTALAGGLVGAGVGGAGHVAVSAPQAVNDARMGALALAEATQLDPSVPQLEAPLEPVSQPLMDDPDAALPALVGGPKTAPDVAPEAAPSWQSAPEVNPTPSTEAAPAPAATVDPLPVTNGPLNGEGADGQGKPAEALAVARQYYDQFPEGHPGRVDPEKADWRSGTINLSELDTETKSLGREVLDEALAENPDHAELASQPITEPIVVLRRDGKSYVWDGNHRIGAAQRIGQEQLPAIIGELKPEPKASPLPTAAPLPEPQPLEGGEKYVRTPAGAKVRTRMEVVDAATLNKATGALQNRDRSRETTTLQVQDIISKFDPELLGDDPSSDRGAPIVGQDSTVLSGNGRMLALNAIFDQYPEQAGRYRAFIEAQGHSTEGMERPVLIRRVAQELNADEARQFVIDSNKDTKLELSPVERAKSDADTVTPDMLARYAGGDLNSSANRGFIEAFAKRLTAGEMGNFIGSDRRLTTAGLDRVENAVIAAAYDSPKLLERIMENPVDDIRAISSSLADVAPSWAKMRQSAKAGELEARYDLTDDLADAAARVSDGRKAGTKPADILSQIDAFDPMSPATREFIKAFYNPQMSRAASRKAVTAFLQDYVDEAGRQAKTDGLFGEEEGKAPVDILKGLLAQRDGNDTGSLFGTKENDHEPIPRFHAARKEGAGREARRRPDADRIGTGRQGGLGRSDGGEIRSSDDARPDEVRQRPDILAGTDQSHDEPVRRGRGSEAVGSAVNDADGAASRNEGENSRSAGQGDGTAAAPDATGHPRVAQASGNLGRGKYQPTFEEASYTNRQSAYASAVHAIGMDEAAFNLLPPARKAKLLADALHRLTGIKAVIPSNTPLQYAIDQLLDAHQTLQGMASALGVNPRALSLDGTLSLKLIAKGNFLGQYSDGEKAISLPGRSNSFAHEWGHALDYYLLDKFTLGDFTRGLSGFVREKGGKFAPTNVRDAFVNLMNAMFFDGADIAAKIMHLQQQIERTKGEKTKAALQKQIDNILSGRSRAKEKSRYWKGANALNKRGGDGSYWTRPTEMLARSFEAWIAFKMSNEGFGNEFATKGNDNYLNGVEERFKLTFPHDAERLRIFDAFQSLIDLLNANGSIREASGFNDVATPAMQRVAGQAENKAKRSLNPFAADLEAVSTWFHNREVDKEENERRAASPMKVMQKVNNVRALAFSAAADGVKMVATRWDSKAALAIHDHFAHDLGGTRHVTRAWGDAVEMRENKALNPVFKELEKVGGSGWMFKKLTREQNDTLAKLLNGETVADDMGLTALADAMRRTFNDEWYANRNAGIELGYVRDTAYLNRQIDRELVAGDVDGFMENAVKVYELVFDRDVGTDAESIAANPETLELFAALAKKLNVDGQKQLRKAIKEEADPDEIGELVEAMFDEVRAGFAVLSASNYRDAILNAETFADYTATYALPDSEKKRSLPAEADTLLRDYYNPSPVSALVHYVQASVRRTEWNQRFGHPKGAKKSGPSIAKQLDDRMAKEGVPASDRQYIWSLVDRMSGRYQRTGFLANPGVANTLGFLRVKGTLGMLGRAFTLSLFEPASLGVVTHNPLHGLKAVAKTWGNVFLKGSRAERMEWARAQGFIKHHMLEQFTVADRFATTADTPTRWDRLSGAMFRNTGLTFLTAASDAAVIDVGRRGILNDMAHRIVGGGKRGKEAENLARELGVRDPQTFANQLVAMNGALPGADWLNGPEGFDYNTALMRLAKYTIQKPGAAELAPLSRNPLASYATYSITGYIQSAYRNMLKRNVLKGARLAKANEPEMLARMVAGTVLSAATLYALQLLASITREYLFNPERQEKWEQEGDWVKNNAALAATRTFSFGWGDPIINASSGLKYNRDFAYVPLGAYAGADAKNLTDVAKLFARNSGKTNTAEHNALKGAYNFALAPAIAGGISAAPGGGPIATALGGGATATLTGPVAADQFATWVVGEKHNRKDADGNKIKSGPTAFDELMSNAEEDDEDE